MKDNDMDMTEAMNRIRSVGASNVRSVPMPGSHVIDGIYQIEVMTEGQWKTIISGLPKMAADSIIQQAINKVILG